MSEKKVTVDPFALKQTISKENRISVPMYLKKALDIHPNDELELGLGEYEGEPVIIMRKSRIHKFDWE